MLYPATGSPLPGVVQRTFVLVIALSMLMLGVGLPSVPNAQLSSSVDSQSAAQAYGKLPLSFEANVGQTDPEVQFISRGSGYTLFLTPTEAVLRLSRPPAAGDDRRAAAEASGGILRMQLVGGNSDPASIGTNRLPGSVNYLTGNDPGKWHTNVPTYARVKYRGVYPGIDLVYYGNQRQLEYDFAVSPGADPDAILLRFQGADGLKLDGNGDLVLSLDVTEIRQRRPLTYQEVNGIRREIPSSYVL